MNTTPLERIRTGNDELDEILGGGLPARSVAMVIGAPGSGKTVLTLQILFRLAAQGSRCLFFTTLSEPALKLIRYMQGFSFFDAGVVDRNIVFADLGSTIRQGGPEGTLAELVRRVEAEEPAIVAIDSFKAIHDLIPEVGRSRTFVYDLAVHLASWGATSLLVGEYEASDISRLPEFAVADAIIRLGNQPHELTAIRELEVLKLRGSSYVTGRHFFDIGPEGMIVHPRVRAPDVGRGVRVSLADRVATGVPDLDALLDGGVPRGSATVIEGATGTGKTLIGLRYLVEGARAGETGVLFSVEELPEQIRAVGGAFGWDLAALERSGRLSIRYTSPVELSTDRFLNDVRREAAGAQRAVLDSLTSMALGVASDRRFRELVHAITKHLRVLGVTPLMTMEIPALLGSATLTGHSVSSAADNVILLRYVEVESHLERALSVLKARGVKHDSELRRLVIDERGPRVGAPFANLRGVLTGIPMPAEGPPKRTP